MGEKEELKYYDVLYDFANVVMHLNEQAFEGEAKKNIEKKICRLIPAFTTLCGVDSKLNNEPAKKPKRKDKPKAVLQSNLIVQDGWGRCPNCGKKCIKVNQNTILVNYLMYCKNCKNEHDVTWRYEPKP